MVNEEKRIDMTSKVTTKQYAQQAVLWITLLSLVGVGSFTGLFRKFSGLPETVVAEINGYDIQKDEFIRRVSEEERRLSLLKQQYGAGIVDVLGGPEELALATLTQEKLLTSAADTLGIVVDPQFAAEKVNDPFFAMQFLGQFVPPYVFDKNGRLDKAGLVKVLQRKGMSVGAFELQVEEILRRMMVGSIINSAVYIPKSERTETELMAHGIRDLEIVHFPYGAFEKSIMSSISHDESAIREFFARENSARRRFWKPELRAGVAVIFTIAPGEARDGLVRRLEILARGNASFGEITKEFKGATKRLSLQERSNDPLVSKLFSLGKVGSRSILSNDREVILIEFSERQESAERPFGEIKTQVEKEFIRERVREALAQELKAYSEKSPEERKHALAERGGKISLKYDIKSAEQLSMLGEDAGRVDVLTVPGTLLRGMSGDDGFIVTLKKIRSEAVTNAEREKLESEVYRQRSQGLPYEFIASLQKRATIRVNQSMLATQRSRR